MAHSLYTDGSYYEYLNAAGMGGYLLDEQGKKIWQFSEQIADGLNLHKHEVYALEYGLKKCIELGIKNLECFMDEQNVAYSLNVKDKVKLDEYVKKEKALSIIIPLLDNFDSINFFYIPRKENKLADELSRKRLLSNIAPKNQIVDGAFQYPNLLCTQQFYGKDKDQFIGLRKDVNNYYLFNLKYGNENNELEIYELVRFPEPKILNIKKHILNKNWVAHYIELVGQTLDSTEHNEIGLTFCPQHKDIDNMMRGVSPISRRSKEPFEKLKVSLARLDKVVIHNEAALLNLVFPVDLTLGSQPSTLEDEEKFIINGLKLLSSPDYEIGSHPEIEKRFPLSKEKSKSVVEIQKKYFGELMKISGKIDHQIRRNNKEIISIHDVRPSKEQALEKITKLRSSLESQGIKLKL